MYNIRSTIDIMANKTRGRRNKKIRVRIVFMQKMFVKQILWYSFKLCFIKKNFFKNLIQFTNSHQRTRDFLNLWKPLRRFGGENHIETRPYFAARFCNGNCSKKAAWYSKLMWRLGDRKETSRLMSSQILRLFLLWKSRPKHRNGQMT